MKVSSTSFLLLSSFIFIACGSSNSNKASNGQSSISKNITISGVPYVESMGIAREVHTTLSLGEEPKDVYMLLSNYAKTNGTVEVKKSLKRTEDRPIQISKKINHFRSTIVHAPKEVEQFRSKIKKYLYQKQAGTTLENQTDITKVNKTSAGTQKLFYFDENAQESTLATARKVISVPTIYGVKTLNIWVSNNSFGEGCAKVKCVTQPMVDALANLFLRPGLDNDIYDWVSNVYGTEWSGHSNKNLINNTNEITILLSDIDNDNSQNGGVVGYFFPKDNFKKEVITGSNEQIMLYADSVLFANGEGGWSIDSFWPKEMISTLAHEFQHMIHFYQKSVLLTDDATDTWINEMLSESTEDLIASKIRHSGSRGVDYQIGSAGDSGNPRGRYPLFNANNTRSLTTWYGALENYSIVNAFGAFLLRNYGGAKVLHDVMHNNLVDEKAIVYAVNQTPQGAGKSFNDLLREWGIGVLLSDYDNVAMNIPRYNFGGYLPNPYNQSIYALGSINFFNYNPQPTLYNSVGTVEGQANYYYKIGTGLTGKIDIDIKLNGETETTLIVK